MLRRLLAVTATLVACLLVAGCSDLTGTGEKGYVTADGQFAWLPPEDRGEPIELAGQDLHGEQMDLADLRGQVVVINVWGAWCAQCRVEMPDLLAAEEELGDSASFVGINIRDSSTATALSFVRNVEMPYPSFYSPDGKALLPFSGTIPPRAIPSTVVLDTDGRVAGSIIGVLPSTLTLVNLVQDIIDGRESAASSTDE